MDSLRIGQLTVSNSLPFVLIAGPCVIEGPEITRFIACELADICTRLGIPLIFKASFDKANRTSSKGHRGVALQEALSLFQEIRHTTGCPVLTDVHAPDQCAMAAQGVDILQIPALLCRQTDLIEAAVRTGCPVLIKKGQFLSPAEMSQVVAKARAAGGQRLMVCERGTSFGYNTLVNDMKGLPVLASTGCPVIFDATHSVQKPGALGDKSGGERQFVECLARAAVAVGVAGIFMETHPDPDRALSDGPNMVPLGDMEALLISLKQIDDLSKSLKYVPFSMGTREENKSVTL
jgi:2-dehydro-3-deoxyphosphooctonate aldolase (KDO 8-P synthase)